MSPLREGDEAARGAAERDSGGRSRSPPHENAAAGSYRRADRAAARAAGSDAGAADGAAVRLLLSLVNIEGAWVTLKPLALQHPLLAPGDLVQVLTAHYTR